MHISTRCLRSDGRVSQFLVRGSFWVGQFLFPSPILRAPSLWPQPIGFQGKNLGVGCQQLLAVAHSVRSVPFGEGRQMTVSGSYTSPVERRGLCMAPTNELAANTRDPVITLFSV